MPRNIPAGLAAHIASEATSLAELIRITPVVGSILAFTSHTQNLTVDGQLYLARPGMRVSLVKSNLKMEIDASEGQGFFHSGTISLADVLRGKFNDAVFERRFCNYDDVSQGSYTFQSGYIGRVSVNDNLFSAEMRGLLGLLSQPVGRILSRRCDVRRLGDSRCKFDMTSTQAGTGVAFRQSLTVSSVVNQITINVTGAVIGSSGGGSEDWFRAGVITWLTGANAGYESEISSTLLGLGGEKQLNLLNAPGQDIVAGDTFYGYAGCDRTMNHCFGKFRNAAQANGNLVNFRGFPYLIGDDLYMPADNMINRPPPGEGT
jgi:uncharacterized phage protein (TIGR02218 family)